VYPSCLCHRSLGSCLGSVKCVHHLCFYHTRPEDTVPINMPSGGAVGGPYFYEPLPEVVVFFTSSAWLCTDRPSAAAAAAAAAAAQHIK